METLARICVKRPVFATMLILSLVVAGGFSFFSLGVDLFPKVDLPTVTVRVINPGASPQEIETEITDRVEEAVNTISGIDELRSTSLEGISQVVITFVLEKNVNVATQEVRDKVNLVIGQLPETAEVPVVQKFDVDAAPVLRLAVSAPRSLKEVTKIADDQIKKRIESIDGVGQVQIIGGSQREIHILVDPERLTAYNITVGDVANAVRAQNAEIPGGRLDEGTRELTVRTKGRIAKPEEFNNVAIKSSGARVIKLSDVGHAEDASEELRTASFLDGTPAVTLTISKQSGQNTVAVAAALKQRLKEIKPTLPPDFKVQIVGDQSVFIQASLNAIEEHLVLGGLLASLVVFVFLWNFRATIIAAVAIPTSIIATFAIMAAVGYTLNKITMLALTLMVGIVIDDAIVVLENIYRFVEEKGMSAYQAAIEGTSEISLAVLATTLSLMAVFLPVGFMGGIVGRFMSSFGLTAAFAIGISLLVSFTLTPMLSSRLIKKEDTEEAVGSEVNDESRELRQEIADDDTFAEESDADVVRQKREDGKAAAHGSSKESWWYGPIDRTYTWLLKLSMAHRWIVVGICALVVISIVPLFMFVGKNFLPVDDQSEYEVSVRTAEGSTLAATSTVLKRIAKDIHTLPGVTDTLTTIGGGAQGAVNSGGIYIKLSGIADRDSSQQELMTKTRELLKNYPKELKTSVQPSSSIGGTGSRNADVQYVISGPNIEKLGEYADDLARKTKTIADATDVDTSLVIGKPEVNVEIDRSRAADLGVRVSDIAQALNTLIAGQKVSTFNQGSDQYDVVVRAEHQYRTNEEDLKKMIVPSSKSGAVTLDRVVKFDQGNGPSAIDRLNRQRQVTVYANVRPGGSASDVTSQMNAFVKQMNIPSGYSTGLAGSSKELQKSAYYFLLAISLSFIFMYIVLAAQFESFIHPVTILLTLPLAIPFGILSLLATGQTVNIFSGLGLLLLFGIVKKNAILQIDHTNHLRETGMSRYEAIIQANRDRLRPILMTTIALVAGMIPLVVSSGAGAGTNRSIGVLVVGGQSMCLLLTLLAVPVFYSLFEDLGELTLFRKIGNVYQNTAGKVGAGFGEGFAKAKAAVFNLSKSKPKKDKLAEEGGVNE